MKLLQGKPIAQKILNDLKNDIQKSGLRPTLAIILIGSDKASRLYVDLKTEAAAQIGMGLKLYKFKAQADEKIVIGLIDKLNRDISISGIIVQLPLPKKLNAQNIIDCIASEKDADGVHPDNIRLFLNGHEDIFPVFPLAITTILASADLNLKGKKSVVICNSRAFGRTMAAILRARGLQSQYILKKNFLREKEEVKNADVLVTAVGKAGFIKGPMVKKKAILIDGGITKENRIVRGDVDPESAKPIAGFLSAVPGGVGPLTVACLLQNVFNLALKQKKNIS